MIGLKHDQNNAVDSVTWTAPTTIVVGAGTMTRAQRDAVIADRWFRTRPHVQAKMASRSDVRRFGGAEDGGLLGSLARSLQAFAADVGGETNASVWEIDQRSGLVRHTKLADVETTATAQNVERVVVDAGSLRERDLSDWDWESAGLINPVAALLAPQVTDAVAWTTLAPASGTTSTRAQNDTRALTWSGQGNTFSDSRRSAVLEGIERLVGALQSSGECSVSAANALTGRIVSPNAFDRYPQEAYGDIVNEFDSARVHEWVSGTSLRDGEPAWIPRELVYYSEQPKYGRWALGTSSGCATGSSVAEATLFGLLELIERDTFVNAWYGAIPGVAIIPQSIPGVEDMLARIRLLGWTVEVGLLRNAWLVPVFVAVVDTGTVRAYGAAAHLDLATAARRALSEAITFAPGREDEVRAKPERAAELLIDPQRAQHIEDHPLLPIVGADPAYGEMCGDPNSAVRLDDAERYADAGVLTLHRAGARDGLVDAAEVVVALVAALARDGIETFSVVQTAPFEAELGLHTVMTIAPSLSQLDFGWTAQRVRTSRRPLEQAQRLIGINRAAQRDIPHPFS